MPLILLGLQDVGVEFGFDMDSVLARVKRDLELGEEAPGSEVELRARVRSHHSSNNVRDLPGLRARLGLQRRGPVGLHMPARCQERLLEDMGLRLVADALVSVLVSSERGKPIRMRAHAEARQS